MTTDRDNLYDGILSDISDTHRSLQNIQDTIDSMMSVVDTLL